MRILVDRHCEHPELPCKVHELPVGTIFRWYGSPSWWMKIWNGNCMFLSDFSFITSKENHVKDQTVTEVYGKLVTYKSPLG